MFINEVTQFTGLSKKAIRFYEKRGLISVSRASNGYREYTDECVEILKKIKLLRLSGISLADIKLLLNDIVNIDEIAEKRKKEIEREHGRHSIQLDKCNDMIKRYKNMDFNLVGELDEYDGGQLDSFGRLTVGIDIGTTSISAVLIDVDEKVQVEFYNFPHHSDIICSDPAFSEQNAEDIFTKTVKLLDHIIATYSNIVSIGVTGQMHGILYIDKNGNAVSNLVNWQDKRADKLIDGERSYCEYIFSETSEKVSTGYGFATHFYNVKNDLVPNDAVSICSIMDYMVMHLCGSNFPTVHTSIASSFGFFDLTRCEFNTEALIKLDMDDIKCPDVTDDFTIVGEYKGIPVAVAIGDNQASFLGSVKNIHDSILLNLGTGGQISATSDSIASTSRDIEIRPLVKGVSINCASSLSGGASYAILEEFFREYTIAVSDDDTPQYEIMNILAEKTYNDGYKPLSVDTFFYGKRSDPFCRGSVRGIDHSNFTPGRLILGFVYGMCYELYDYFKDYLKGKHSVVASGNVIQRIPVIKNIIADMFGLPVQISLSKEEASRGSALFSALCAKVLRDLDDFAEFILYRTN